jgi:hypothetical protein
LLALKLIDCGIQAGYYWQYLSAEEERRERERERERERRKIIRKQSGR